MLKVSIFEVDWSWRCPGNVFVYCVLLFAKTFSNLVGCSRSRIMAGGAGRQFLEMLVKRVAASGFDKRTLSKLKIVSGGEGKCVAELKVEEEHQNTGGTLHGGMTATMVDIVSTLALMTNEKNPSPGVSVDLHVSYLKAAKLGEEILVEASTVKAGRNLAFLHVDIKNKATGDLIATGSHTKFVAQL